MATLVTKSRHGCAPTVDLTAGNSVPETDRLELLKQGCPTTRAQLVGGPGHCRILSPSGH